MQTPDKINVRARDRLVEELADRGISFEMIPHHVWQWRFRDILAWLHKEHKIPYCYRCQRLTNPEEMPSYKRNICNQHGKKKETYKPDPKLIKLLQQKLLSSPIESIDVNGAVEDIQTTLDTIMRTPTGIDLDAFLNKARGNKAHVADSPIEPTTNNPTKKE